VNDFDSDAARNRESNAVIAGRLGLTEGTVKQYLRRIYAELGVENRVEAAVLGHVAELAGDQANIGRSTS
jgi:DNA-binding NarL/FixJ family response regulator